MSDAYDPNGNVPYNAAYEDNKTRILVATIQAAYDNAMIKTGNQHLAEQAAMDAATQGAQLIKIYGDQGLQALSQANQSINAAGQLGVSVADLLSRIQGPANAFAYDRAINGVNASGLSNAIGALTGSYRPPAFQAMGATSPLTLDTMASQTGGGSGGIIDQLLGITANAQSQQGQVAAGQLPFSIPQFNPDGSGNTLGTNATQAGSPTAGTPTANTAGTPVASVPGQPTTINNHFYGGTPTGDTHTGFSLGTPQYSPQAQQFLNGLPDPNHTNVRGYFHSDPYTQKLDMSGWAAKGYDPEQLQGQFAAKLPQFGAPRVGLVG